MMKRMLTLLALSGLLGLTGCASGVFIKPLRASAPACGSCSTCGACKDEAPNTPNSAVSASRHIQAVGRGAVAMPGQMSQGQMKLMAMRAAQVDAYRALAERVYGLSVSGGTTVSAFAAQNDNLRVFVDAFIRGARVVSVVAQADGIYEATVELPLPVAFLDCVARRAEGKDAPGCQSLSAGLTMVPTIY